MLFEITNPKRSSPVCSNIFGTPCILHTVQHLETIFGMRRINEAFLEPRHEFIVDGTSIETPPLPSTRIPRGFERRTG